MIDDIRPLCKTYMGSSYFRRKASQLRISRQQLDNILSGRSKNPEVYDECLSEVRERMEARQANFKRIEQLQQLEHKIFTK